MKLTNIHDLPSHIMDIVQHAKSLYNSGKSDYTPSSLNTPPQIRSLMKTHSFELEQDASETLASILGTGLHDLFERALSDNPKYVVEKRFYRNITMPDGSTRLIGGQIDLYIKPENKLSDYKVTSIFKIRKGENDEWRQQCNINRWIMSKPLFEHNGELIRIKPFPIDQMSITAFAKDWRRGESNKDADYPNTPVVEIPISFMSDEDVESFIIKTIIDHESSESRECSSEERWADEPSFAIMKKGGKRAVSNTVTSDRNVAEAKLIELTESDPNTEYYIDERNGDMWRRCQGYCIVSDFCEQYQKGKASIKKEPKHIDGSKLIAEFDLG